MEQGEDPGFADGGPGAGGDRRWGGSGGAAERRGSPSRGRKSLETPLGRTRQGQGRASLPNLSSAQAAVGPYGSVKEVYTGT